MNALTEFLFAAPAPRSTPAIIAWWERRRLAYNAWVGGAGLVSLGTVGLAGALMGRGDRDAAADQLLDIVRRDREWNDGAARTRLLQLLEAIGLEDPWVAATRRRLSTVLFG